MITINNVQLRNLEEQVLKNKDDIESIRQASELLNAFGIKVVGQVETADELPSPADYPGSYGDAYLVGTKTPYDYYIFTRPNDAHPTAYWLNIGEFPLAGPQGPQGEKGEKGDTGTGSKWYAGNTNPTFQADNNDQYLNTSDGSVFSYSSVGWTRTGNIRGPQGIQGIQGERGPMGPMGPQGIQGERGDVGGIVNIRGQVASENQLPTPASLNNLSIAYLVGTSTPYTLYIQVGGDPETALWQNMGQLNVATYVTVNGQYVNILEMNNYQSKIKFIQLTGTSGTLTSAQINLLKEDNTNYIIVDNEIYRLDDLMTSNGYLIYTHVGQTNTNDVFIKTLSILLTNNSWSIQEKKMLDPSTVSNPNLLINGDFRINQRGQTTYTESMKYTVDRWEMTYGSSLVLNADHSVTHTSSASGQGIRQFIENPSFLNGKTVTYSVEAQGDTYGFYISIKKDSTTIAQKSYTSTDRNRLSVTTTIPNDTFVDSDRCFVTIYNLTGAENVTIYNAKLEVGSVATAFSSRPYAEELAMCQRYYQNINVVTSLLYARTTGQLRAMINFKTEMRTAPTLTQLNTIRVFGIVEGTTFTQSSVNIGGGTAINREGAMVALLNFSGLTINNIYQFDLGVSTEPIFTADSEIY